MTETTIRSFRPGDAVEGMIGALRSEGVIIVEELVPRSTLDDVFRQIRPHLDDAEIGGGAFYGRRAKRVPGLIAKAPSFARMVSDPVLLAIADAILSPNCARFQMALSSVLEVWDGGSGQPLHRDEGVYAPYLQNGSADAECLVSLMWAGSDFTADNGATRLVLGSHRWSTGRVADGHEELPAIMAAGSVAVWLGSTLHGMGINTTDSPRTGFVSAYSLGWLKQEENQFLVVPPDLARTFPREVQDLVGYHAHSPLLGWYNGRHGYLLADGPDQAPDGWDDDDVVLPSQL